MQRQRQRSEWGGASQLKVVRIRRARLPTARSYSFSKKFHGARSKLSACPTQTTTVPFDAAVTHYAFSITHYAFSTTHYAFSARVRSVSSKSERGNVLAKIGEQNVLSLERSRLVDAVCLSFCRCNISRQSGVLKGRFSWFLEGILKVQTCVILLESLLFRTMSTSYLFAKLGFDTAENKASKVCSS